MDSEMKTRQCEGRSQHLSEGVAANWWEVSTPFVTSHRDLFSTSCKEIMDLHDWPEAQIVVEHQHETITRRRKKIIESRNSTKIKFTSWRTNSGPGWSGPRHKGLKKAVTRQLEGAEGCFKPETQQQIGSSPVCINVNSENIPFKSFWNVCVSQESMRIFPRPSLKQEEPQQANIITEFNSVDATIREDRLTQLL